MKPNTWDTIFLRHLRRGEDHGSAAYAADQWEKRQHQDRWKHCHSSHCANDRCRSPHDCSANLRKLRGQA